MQTYEDMLAAMEQNNRVSSQYQAPTVQRRVQPVDSHTAAPISQSGAPQDHRFTIGTTNPAQAPGANIFLPPQGGGGQQGGEGGGGMFGFGNMLSNEAGAFGFGEDYGEEYETDADTAKKMNKIGDIFMAIFGGMGGGGGG